MLRRLANLWDQDCDQEGWSEGNPFAAQHDEILDEIESQTSAR